MVEHLVQAAQVAESTLHLAGDSIVAQLPAGSFGERALNLGIGGDLAVGLTYRISRYPFIHPGHRTIVHIGINDVLRGEDGRTVGTIREIVEALASRGVIVVLSALLPVDEQALGRPINARVRELNAEMAKFCAAIANCRFADAGRVMTDGTGQLRATLHTDDGVHLSADGYKIFVRVLREALVRASSD
jgi:lysophospholipase L1-like esterase